MFDTQILAFERHGIEPDIFAQQRAGRSVVFGEELAVLGEEVVPRADLG